MRKPLPLLLEPVPAWMEQAACRKYPSHWWFLEPDQATRKEQEQRAQENKAALQICRAHCPVLFDCLQLANEWTDRGRRPYGVVMAGIRWATSKYPHMKPAFRPCACCGRMMPPWTHGNQTRCAGCIKQGAKT